MTLLFNAAAEEPRLATHPLAPLPVPAHQAVPLPYDQVSLQREGQELTRFHYGTNLRRPFLFPIIGPVSGRSLTRMGHPHDPITHSHHNSVWISHHDVSGVDFWSDHGTGKGRLEHQHIIAFEDGAEGAVSSLIYWIDAEGQPLLKERRRMALASVRRQDYWILMDLEFSPVQDTVTLGDTAFGFIGVRMAKSIGVHDGRGRILNSEGHLNEAEAFRRPARWVDYSGAIAQSIVEGITLMDHPSNLNHPTVFHVRNDGWMGACISFQKPIHISQERPLHLRYGLYVHEGHLSLDALNQVWTQFAATSPVDVSSLKK